MTQGPSFQFAPGSLEAAKLQKKFQSQSSWAMTCFFIGGTSVLAGVAAQFISWEQEDLTAAHTVGWWILAFGVVMLVIGSSLWSSFKKTISEYDRVKKEFGISMPGDRDYPSRELDALAALRAQDPVKFAQIMAEARSEVERRHRGEDGLNGD